MLRRTQRRKNGFEGRKRRQRRAGEWARRETEIGRAQGKRNEEVERTITAVIHLKSCSGGALPV